ncbi:riboflavin synthase, partial [Pelagibacteraceae bacterium]|nr:riboflavin synthase [Pelagibacteraceae bacterium]
NQGIIKAKTKYKNSLYIEIETNLKIHKKDIGSSISCNGVCLTLVKVFKKSIFFYLSKETLVKSNFRLIKVGSKINIERSMVYGQEISGNYTQGHIDTTGRINKITILDKTWKIGVLYPFKFKKYLVEKASININGVSLTISKINKKSFELDVIPHTLKLTNLINLKIGNIVNIEFDIFSKYLLKINN